MVNVGIIIVLLYELLSYDVNHS